MLVSAFRGPATDPGDFSVPFAMVGVLELLTAALPGGWEPGWVGPDHGTCAHGADVVCIPVGGTRGLRGHLRATSRGGLAQREQVRSVLLLAKAHAELAVGSDLAGLPLDAAPVTDAELREALDDGDVFVAYQPIVSLRSGAVVSVEALARWNRADGSSVTPDRFIPVAERSGLIDELTSHVLALVAMQSMRWLAAGTPLRCAVNVSPAQLESRDRIRALSRSIEASGIDPEHLTIEITESSAMTAPADATLLLERLRRDGVKVSIDDFGTAYSSLQRLTDLPFDTLKIDRSFVNEIGVSGHGTNMVRSIIQLAKGIDVDVIAEGIEKVEQATHLSGWRCNFGQGWHYGRPVPASEIRLTAGT